MKRTLVPKKENFDKDWKLMMIPVFNWNWVHDNNADKWAPIYGYYTSPKMITWRYLAGDIKQTKKGYIDFPKLLGLERSRSSNLNPRQPTEKEYEEWNPVLQKALEEDEPKYLEGY